MLLWDALYPGGIIYYCQQVSNVANGRDEPFSVYCDTGCSSYVIFPVWHTAPQLWYWRLLGMWWKYAQPFIPLGTSHPAYKVTMKWLYIHKSAIPTLAYHAQGFRVTPLGIPLWDPETLALFLAFRSLIVACLSVNVSWIITHQLNSKHKSMEHNSTHPKHNS